MFDSFFWSRAVPGLIMVFTLFGISLAQRYGKTEKSRDRLSIGVVLLATLICGAIAFHGFQKSHELPGEKIVYCMKHNQ